MAFTVSMDLDSYPGSEKGSGNKTTSDSYIHRAADGGRKAAKVGWKMAYYIGVFNAVRTLPPYFSREVGIWPLSDPIHARLDAGVRRCSDREGSSGDERSPIWSKKRAHDVRKRCTMCFHYNN